MPDRAFRAERHASALEPLQTSQAPLWDSVLQPPGFGTWPRKAPHGQPLTGPDSRPDPAPTQSSKVASTWRRFPAIPGLQRNAAHKKCEDDGLTLRRRASTSRRRAFSSAIRAVSARAFSHRLSAANPRTASSSVPPLSSRDRAPSLASSARQLPRADDEARSVSDAASSRRSGASEEDGALSDDDSFSDGLADPMLREELESRWILNLSMAFRDKLDTEKFFITFAELPNLWRRVTVSCNYANAPADSLEAALKDLHYPRDKSAHIYEAIRDSLASIQFYDTVTNLKLETADGRLHVHVTEDVNEIIKYPPLPAVQHLAFGQHQIISESSVNFTSHLSGFVYKVKIDGKSYIKKEIPGPDMVDEFLYEVNALFKLKAAADVIDLFALVVDESRTKIKGLLISYADRGTLVDLIYDHREAPLSWERRSKWARQIVSGLAAVHEAGFVQGDFTLSNIVIDEFDDAKIIDINRRGCPVGWEPPEFLGLIESGQRISMYIGVKSDVYQLGMVLWALASLEDEPERLDRPLSVNLPNTGAPDWLGAWVDICLKDDPSERWTARDLLEKPLQSSNPDDVNAFLQNQSAADADLDIDHDDAFDYPQTPDAAGSPDMLFVDRSKHTSSRANPSSIQTRPHASHSISGADHFDEEPFSFDLDEPSDYVYTSRRTPARPNHQAPALAQIGHPLHQDSGLGAELREEINGYRAAQTDCPEELDRDSRAHQPLMHPRFHHPNHQDSGFQDQDFLDLDTIAADSKDTRPPLSSRSRNAEFAGIGAAHASGA